MVKFLLDGGGRLPERKTDGACGYDLYVPRPVSVRHGRQVIGLGFRMEMDYGLEAKIEPRSGFSAKGMEGIGPDGLISRFDCDVLTGKIDSDYRGEVGVIVKNFGPDFMIEEGTRIAQMTFYEPIHPRFAEVSSLGSTGRGDGGFNSTGVR